MTEYKMLQYKKGSFGWLKEQAKKDGFGDNIKNWKIYKAFEKDLKNIDLVEKILEENKVEIKDTKMFYKFWSMVDIKDNKEECWNWNMYIDLKGYAQFKLNGKVVRSNRVSHILTKGDIPYRLQVQHLCNNPSCCNPNHLELGNSSKNSRYITECGRRNNNVLTDDQVVEIKKLFGEQRCQHPEFKQWQITEPLAKKFGVCKGTIEIVINGKHVRG